MKDCLCVDSRNKIHWRLTLRVAAVAVSLCGASIAQTPPRTLDQIHHVATPRGPFKIWTFDSASIFERTGTPTYSGAYHGIAHPFSTWAVGSYSSANGVETWSDCAVPGRAGTFDVRRSTAYVDPYLALMTHELRLNFPAGSGVGVHRFRWVARLDPTLPGIADGEARVMLPATGCIYIRDAVHNLTRAMADTDPGYELGYRPYWREPNAADAGYYHNRLNTADIMSIHAFDAAGAPAWGLGVYSIDPSNAGLGHLLIASNPDAARSASLEFGDDLIVANDHLENNAVPGAWIPVSTVLVRALPSVTPKEFAWWENVDFVRTHLLDQLAWVRTPSPLSSSPRWSRCAVLGIGYGLNDLPDARVEAARILSFFDKYDRGPIVAPEYHYVPSFSSWTDQLYTEPMTARFSNLMGRVGRFHEDFRSRTHILTYLATAFYGATAPEPPHPLAGARAFNDQFEPYYFGINWRVDPSDPAYVAAFDQAVATLMAAGVEGAYFDAMFGEGVRNYRQHRGADPSNHLDQVALVDRARDFHGWNGLFVGENSRLGNRYAAGAFVPCGLRAVPGGAEIPFVDALIHDRRLTIGAGDILEQWFAHARFGYRNATDPTRRDLQNIVHDYVFGFVKGQLVVDGRTEYTVDPGGPAPTVRIQIFEADPALQRSWAAPDQVLGFAVLKDVADHVYPRMMWWRHQTPALQEGRMLQPPYPSAWVDGMAVDEWFLLEKDYFFKVPIHTIPPGETSVYETERYPVSFWALPSDPDRLTLFTGNPTYDPVTLRFGFSTADYPSQMSGSSWDVILDPGPDEPADLAPVMILEGATVFDFSVKVPPLAFTRVSLIRGDPRALDPHAGADGGAAPTSSSPTIGR